MVAVISAANEALFGIFILVFVLFLFCLCLFGMWVNRQKDSVSPYTRSPLRRGSDLSYYSSEQVLRYLYNYYQYDNRIFDLKKAAICLETGRIFPDALNWLGKIDVDWSFLQKRYPGKYISWGSLTTDQQEIVRSAHLTLDGFQVEFSSPEHQPKALEAKYAYAKPGPLYVDIETNVLLGWKCVPRTDLEVLIVQKPYEAINLTIS